MACAKFYGQVVFSIIVLKFIYIAAVIHIAVIAVITVANCMDTLYLMIVLLVGSSSQFWGSYKRSCCKHRMPMPMYPSSCPPLLLSSTSIEENQIEQALSDFFMFYCHIWVSCQFSLMAFISLRKFLFSCFHEKWSILSNASKQSIRMT